MRTLFRHGAHAKVTPGWLVRTYETAPAPNFDPFHLVSVLPGVTSEYSGYRGFDSELEVSAEGKDPFDD